LILVLIAIVVIAVLTLLGEEVNQVFSTITSALS
jgi:Flp pilus assembly pilin Flp